MGLITTPNHTKKSNNLIVSNSTKSLQNEISKFDKGVNLWKLKMYAFIGLGVMGYPMAGYLKKNNLNVTVLQ